MFFEFSQNNSGGRFTEPAVSVVVEAKDAREANQRAEYEAGLYFDGCSEGSDCPCCGDRWYEQWSDEEGNAVPSHYGVPLTETETDSFYGDEDVPFAKVYYLNGTVETYKAVATSKKNQYGSTVYVLEKE